MHESPSVEIEEPHKVPELFDLGLCTVTYWDLAPYRVMEWVEMQSPRGDRSCSLQHEFEPPNFQAAESLLRYGIPGCSSSLEVGGRVL